MTEDEAYKQYRRKLWPTYWDFRKETLMPVERAIRADPSLSQQERKHVLEILWERLPEDEEIAARW